MSDLLVEKDSDAYEQVGYHMVVDKQIEWGIIDQNADPSSQPSNPSYLGFSKATQKSQVEVEKKEKETQKQKSWQPSQQWSSWSSNWWGESAPAPQSWQPPQQVEDAWTSWSQETWQQDWTIPGVSAHLETRTQAWASIQPPKDPRGKEVHKYWGSGARR